MSEKYLGENIMKLGFGLMRLPMIGEEIDIEQTKKMVDEFIAKGGTYFDTAYVYIGGKSEVALKEAVVDRYPRDKFQAATKLPVWECKDRAEMEEKFATSLSRAGLDYYDFYLLHALSEDRVGHLDKIGAWEFMREIKEQGKIKHLGFSFHDKASVLDDILTKHPEVEFVQLQLNYADWNDDNVQSKLCYEVARKHNVPVIVMEPVKGGSLAGMLPEIQELFKAANPNASVASWAMRYSASLDGIITSLSGMSNEAQMHDNIETMKNFKPLTDDERAVIDKAVAILDSKPTIPCTSCKYCVDDCPQKINIPEVFSSVNMYTLYGDINPAKRHYGFATKDKGKAADCISCGTCEGLCPQHIGIIEELSKASALLD